MVFKGPKFMLRNNGIIPSVMFHSVGLEGHPWVWSHISERLDLFEKKLKAIKAAGFYTIDWYQLYNCMGGKKKLEPNAVFLTFDDGYLDNWCLVFPLLKKYQLKATIFVNPEFIDPRQDVRLTLEDVWNDRLTFDELDTVGFLSWPELRAMESSGLVDIQSHSLSHTWFFSSPNLVDYHRHQGIYQYPWMSWNLKPERKPYYLNENQKNWIDEGFPILQHEKSLVVRRFMPDPAAMVKINDFIVSKGVEVFHKKNNWLKETNDFIENDLGGLDGVFETDAERKERIYSELSQSKLILEKGLHKTVDYICWPGGGNDSTVHELAREAGYKSWTLGSRDNSNHRNRFNIGPNHIKRIGSGSEVKYKGNSIGQGGAVYFLLMLLAHQDSKFYHFCLRVYIAMRLLGNKFIPGAYNEG